MSTQTFGLAKLAQTIGESRATYTLIDRNTARVYVNSGTEDECLDYIFKNHGEYALYNDITGLFSYHSYA